MSEERRGEEGTVEATGQSAKIPLKGRRRKRSR